MTGKTHKISNVEKNQLKAERIEEKINYERAQLQNSGYEMIFPQIYDEEKHKEYETILKKAQELWDDFTTGKNKKN